MNLDLIPIGCKVYSILIDNPESQDDDWAILASIWEKESNATTAKEVFDEIRSGKFTIGESITRIRRKHQEKHTALRGKKWAIRHKMENEFIEQLTFFDRW